MDVHTRVLLSASSALLAAVQRLLRPLARLLMLHGVDYPSFANLAKGVFVDVAAHDFPDDGGALTDSRVSLLSGVHRREVKRLRAETLHTVPPQSVSMGSQIVARWCADPLFLDPQRRPRPLPRLARRGGEASFENLVSSVSKDIRPRAVLDEWLRLGVATLDEADCVHLVEAAFVPAQGGEEKAFYFGKNLHDHMAAAAHNLLDQHPPLLERSVYYDGLTPESVLRLRELSRELAVSAMQEINRRAMELQRDDADKQQARERMTFGVYFYTEAERRDAPGMPEPATSPPGQP